MPRRALRRTLRQAAPRAVRRIRAVRRHSGEGAHHPVRRYSRRLRTGRRTPRPPDSGLARRHARSFCYEAIFPTEIGDLFSGAERPRWLLINNDFAWFGQTPGPYQHFAQARLRAIELGAPLVRDANSGISAVLDGFGREIVVTPLGAEGVLDAELPEALPPTWQSRLGSVGAALIGRPSCWSCRQTSPGRRRPSNADVR